MADQFAIYSKCEHGYVRVHYVHLTEQQAEDEVERLNGHLLERGHPAVYWAEKHHPDAVFVIS